jgi:hypothetical protein
MPQPGHSGNRRGLEVKDAGSVLCATTTTHNVGSMKVVLPFAHTVFLGCVIFGAAACLARTHFTPSSATPLPSECMYIHWNCM